MKYAIKILENKIKSITDINYHYFGGTFTPIFTYKNTDNKIKQLKKSNRSFKEL